MAVINPIMPDKDPTVRYELTIYRDSSGRVLDGQVNGNWMGRMRNMTQRLENGRLIASIDIEVDKVHVNPDGFPEEPDKVIPEAPENLQVTVGNAAATLKWEPPANADKATILGYQVSKDNGVTWEAAQSALYHQFSGLTNGLLYNFAVRAYGVDNLYGPAAKISGTPEAPVSAPSAATNVEVAAGNGQATLTWLPPVNDGNSPIQRYEVTRDAGASWSTANAADNYTFTGLTNGTQYIVGVRAVNAVGAGPAILKTVVPDGPILAVPTAPTEVSAIPGDASAELIWDEPLSDGGSPITSYEVSTNGTTWTPADTDEEHTFTGLVNGTPVTLYVRAVNAIGAGAYASVVTTPVAVPTIPGAPTALQATPGDGSADLVWTAPTSDGGAAITKYEVSSDGATYVDADTMTSHNFTGLTNGTSYDLSVRAVNSVGPGPSASTSVTPTA